jgi:hypothetical protein
MRPIASRDVQGIQGIQAGRRCTFLRDAVGCGIDGIV